MLTETKDLLHYSWLVQNIIDEDNNQTQFGYGGGILTPRRTP